MTDPARTATSDIARPALRMVRGRGSSAGPEGPFESENLVNARGISSPEMARFLDFVEQMEIETDSALGMRGGLREMRLMIALVRDHLEGRLTTPSSLSAASGLSHGTATRTIADMIERGLITRRPRTRTGKSFSLHPSPELMGRWQEYARRVKAILGSAFGITARGSDASDYFFGGSYMAARIISPPAIRERKLELAEPLRVLVHADPTFMAMHTLKKQFEMILGVAIDSRALSIDRLHDEALANGAADFSRYDIVACDLPWFGEFAGSGILRPLDDLMADSDFSFSDFHPDAVASTRHGGRPYGVPVQTTPELLVYRTDLFEEAGIAPPRTADEVLDAARRLSARHPDLRGISWNGARGTPLGHTFLFVMGAFGQPVIDLRRLADGYDPHVQSGEECRPMLHTDAARQTAEYLRALLDVSPPNTLNMSWFERARTYARGEVAMSYCYTLLAPLFELDPGSPACGRSGYLPHPHGPEGWPVAPLGGYALGIPANLDPDRVPAVWDALEVLTSSSAAKLYIENGSLVSPRFSVSADPEIFNRAALVPQVDEMARSGLLRIWPRPPIPEITRIIGIVGEEIHAMLAGSATIEGALSAAQNRIDALMRANGRY
ncbi:MAG: extracellular solute-binding protein [Azospirillaceae bacterium]